jgi:hypothetical protein
VVSRYQCPEPVGNVLIYPVAMGRRKREYQAHAAMVEANELLAAGWIENPLLTATEGAFHAFGHSPSPSDTVSFYATDGSGTNSEYPLHAFDWIRIEAVQELEEPVAAHHASTLSKSESPNMVMGYIGGSILFVLLPMKGTAEQWGKMFGQAGVKVLPAPEWAQWECSAWNQDQRDGLTAALEEAKVPFRWRATVLQSGKQNEQAVLDVFAKIGAT